MRKLYGPRGLLCIGVLGLLAFASWVSGRGEGGHPRPAPIDAAEQPPAPKPFYFGTVTCARGCHDRQTPLVDKQFPPLCQCTELTTWQKDKHKQAYTILEGERAKTMGRLLGLKVKVTQAPECLSCHGVVEPDKERLDKTFLLEEGVSCVICHGAAAKWVTNHSSPIVKEREEWRKMGRSEKEAKFGMRDLWDPGKRAALCASCHVGSVAERKVVTHEMYAAGHPPLPGFEVATFGDAMPRHWQRRKEKLPAVQDILDYKEGEAEETRLVVIGSAVAFRESMRLLADQAEACAKEKSVLDFANFDCAACHHDLKGPPGGRSSRFPPVRPGRPGLRPWPTALLELAVRHFAGYDPEKSAAESKALQKKLAGLQGALTERTYGNPEKVRAEADALAKWVGDLIERLGKAAYDQKTARRVLEELCTLAQDPALDYESARQIAWAARVVNAELVPPPKNDKAICQQLCLMAEEMKLDLPSGREREILRELREALGKMNDFDPKKFRARFAELAKLLHE